MWNVRKEGLNIMMSMKGDGKPISFIEDCAVRLEDLAEYTDRLTQVFHKHGTRGTWYAHASVGTLHVRPVINLKQELGAKQMRAIAEEAFAMVREYKGSHSGEHGDGLVRSECHEPMFGSRLVRAFEEVKDTFDPAGLFNPGKIVRPPKMDDRSLFRFKPGYRQVPLDTALDWSEWGSFASAAEMCNNNGACRKSDPGVMCPSYRATGDEQHLTRGRANTLRLALSGQLGPDALVSDEMRDTLALCVWCKGCKRECPTGVDMARMKIEFLHHYRQEHGLDAARPRRSPICRATRPRRRGSRASRSCATGCRRWPRSTSGSSASARGGRCRAMVAARRSISRRRRHAGQRPTAAKIVLLVDTFNRYFEPENARAAERVLTRAGYRVTTPEPAVGGRCAAAARFSAAGLVDEAREEARRMLGALAPAIAAGTPIIGLEPACLLTLRDEFPAMLPGAETQALAARALLFEEFVAAERKAGRFDLKLAPMPGRNALLHGHCHQKAFGTVDAAAEALRLIPELTWRPSTRPAAAWPASSASKPSITTSRCGSASWACCRRCAPPRPRRAGRLRHELPPPDRRRRRPRSPPYRPHPRRGVGDADNGRG